MAHSPLDRASGRFRSTLEMLEMLESVLGSVSDAIDEAADIEFAPRFRRLSRQFAYTVIGAEGEPDDEVREDFEDLFDADWSWNQFEKHHTADDHRELTEEVDEFCRWIGTFEQKLGGTTGGSLEGLTSGIVDSMEAIGEAFERGEAARDRLEETIAAGRVAIRELGLTDTSETS